MTALRLSRGGVNFESYANDAFGNPIAGFYASNCSFSRNSANQGGIADNANWVLLNCIIDAENIDSNGVMFFNTDLKNTPADISTVTAPRAPNLIEGFSNNGESIFAGFTPDFGEALVIDADHLWKIWQM